MEYRAAVSYDPIQQMTEVRLGTDEGHVALTVDEFGNVIMVEQEEGASVPPFLRLPRGAMFALRDAFNGHAPPTSDDDLREALNIERARVDRILDKALED